MKKIKITDIGIVERAVKNKIYPKHSTLVKLSASDDTSKGGVQLLLKDSEVEQRFAVIIPYSEFDKRYIYFAILIILTNSFISIILELICNLII